MTFFARTLHGLGDPFPTDRSARVGVDLGTAREFLIHRPQKGAELMQHTVVFVHGAFVRDGSWWWGSVAQLLKGRRIASKFVDLPSCGDTGPLGDMHADADAVRSTLTGIAGPVIVVGHSYGGMAITEGAANVENVRHLVYVSAIVPDGQSVLTSGWVSEDNAGATNVDFREDGTLGEDPRAFVDRLLDAFPEHRKLEAMEYVTRQSVAVYEQEIGATAWRDIPSTYVVCERDRDVPVDTQLAQAKPLDSVVRLTTNHFPHLERPELVAETIAGIAERLSSEG